MEDNINFKTTNWVVELNGNTYLKFVDRLEQLYQIMRKVIAHHCLNLEFESCNEGLLLHNYKPHDDIYLYINLKINGNKIECESM